ncbi:uncharacterized protein I206_104495 [Kwoniella pini CBS 10737]|uniref:Homeobox domain-containing protein n=1 Tax=Kwoniella pini CBS 10737 TaxID=1296096 RepID=A0A1B9I701_9TREE|nr:uncharacterized protein I206_02026 [Kwoniella pini CBS 10737]OCF51312.1 hypothetical protein I206_02026 [Kwoniella pini CBS 10737]
MTTKALDVIFNTAARISEACQLDPANSPLRSQGVEPSLVLPTREWILPYMSDLSPRLLEMVWQRANQVIQEERKTTLGLYRTTVSRMVSLESYGGMSDRETEFKICKAFETHYQKSCFRIRQTVHATLSRQRGLEEDDRFKRSASFSQRTILLLEAAYTRTKILSTAETAIIAEAAGITPHQVRTWFQNKRNRGDKRQQISNIQPQARKIQGLPKRTQPQASQYIKEEPQSLPNRKVRGLPRRAQASHNAPQTPMFSETPYSDISSSVGNGISYHTNGNAERMKRSPSSSSSVSNSTDIPNGGFTSPYESMLQHGQEVPYISLEWGAGMLNIPMEMLQSNGIHQVPVFNFTPPSPLNLNFNQVLNPAHFADTQNMFGGQMYDTPVEKQSFNPFTSDPNGLSSLESIESLLQSALSDPSSFEQFPTLATSPQFSLDSLSPQSEVPSLASLGSPDWSNESEKGLDPNFFQALEGMLAQQGLSSINEIDSALDEGSSAGPSRCVSMSSLGDYGSGVEILSANEGIDLSYIAAIPLPPSPQKSSFDLQPIADYSGPTQLDESIYMGSLDDTSEFLNSGMCTPSSTTSGYPLVTPTSQSEPLAEVDQSQWSWIGGVLPFDNLAGMEIEMMEFGDAKMDGWSSGGGELIAA